jgi:hypothetical protein
MAGRQVACDKRVGRCAHDENPICLPKKYSSDTISSGKAPSLDLSTQLIHKRTYLLCSTLQGREGGSCTTFFEGAALAWQLFFQPIQKRRFSRVEQDSNVPLT